MLYLLFASMGMNFDNLFAVCYDRHFLKNDAQDFLRCFANKSLDSVELNYFYYFQVLRMLFSTLFYSLLVTGYLGQPMTALNDMRFNIARCIYVGPSVYNIIKLSHFFH